MNSEQLTPDSGLQRLLDGNKRFTLDKLQHPDRTRDRREATAAAQTPFAIILGCSDARVSPEILFDQGIGDIFTIRVAGNVVGPLELDSIEFSVIYNHSVIVLVLGHENCGAVTATMEGQIKDIESIAELIAPAIAMIKREGGSLENAIKANVNSVVEQLQRSPVLLKAINEGKLKVVGAYYTLRTGHVEIL